MMLLELFEQNFQVYLYCNYILIYLNYEKKKKQTNCIIHEQVFVCFSLYLLRFERLCITQ